MTKRIALDANGFGFWLVEQDKQSFPVHLELCPRCTAVVIHLDTHIYWHEQLEGPQ